MNNMKRATQQQSSNDIERARHQIGRMKSYGNNETRILAWEMQYVKSE